MGTAARKAIDVRDEAVRLGALPIQAEVAHDALAIAARIGGEMVLGCAPHLESGMIEVEAPVLVQKATQRADDPLLMDIVAPEHALVVQILVDRLVEGTLLRCRDHETPSTMQVARSGSGSATSRSVSV
jgi:hypothetical protein